MSRLIAIAVLGTATFLAVPVQAQFRGATRAPVPMRAAGFPVARAIPAPLVRLHFPPPPARFRAPVRIPLIRRPSFGRPVFLRRRFVARHTGLHLFLGNFAPDFCFTDPFIDPFFCRRFFFRNQFLFPFATSPVFAGGVYYPAVSQAAAPASDQQQSGLANEVDRLTQEVERLREEEDLLRYESQPRQTPPASAAEEKTVPTVLVFRDRTRSEVQNYAIVDKTLWIFTEQRARKVPLSDLDVEATRKANAERSMEFVLPEALR